MADHRPQHEKLFNLAIMSAALQKKLDREERELRPLVDHHPTHVTTPQERKV